MSYCIYIGKNHTETGYAYLAGYGDEPSSHWLEITPARTHLPGTTLSVGVTEQANFPGELIQIPQAEQTARYIAVNYSYYRGLPAPLTNGGLNEHHVAVRDVWSPSRPELQAMTPKPQTGLNYSDLARIVLARATSARHGVELMGNLIAEYGEATYGGNSHLIADAHEGWVVIQFAGGQGLWAAERLGANDIRISRPGYIGEMPLDYQTHPDFMGSANLVALAVAQGWYDPDSGEPFNVNKVYGDGKMRWDGATYVYEELVKRANSPHKISLRDVMWALRTPKLTGDRAGYGQIVPLRPDVAPELGMLWHTQTGAVAAPFVPVYLGVQAVPPEYQMHRYLTADEAALFVNIDRQPNKAKSRVPQAIESTRSAFASFKRLFYLTMQHHERFLPEVTEVWQAFEGRLMAQLPLVEETAVTLYAANQPELARHYLTYFSQTEAMAALRLAETLADSLEARTKLLFGIDAAQPDGSPEVIW
ncbi:MAG: C69 family dipeptidase [Ardenticatenaceae bacterium]|nr:C69 family dipeptidase [Ardenticatenaceae bacterium]